MGPFPHRILRRQRKSAARLIRENVNSTMVRGAISVPMPRMVSAQNPANRRDAKRQVIHSSVALDAPAARSSNTQMPTAMSVTIAQIALIGKLKESPLVRFSHPAIRTTGSTLNAILNLTALSTSALLGQARLSCTAHQTSRQVLGCWSCSEARRWHRCRSRGAVSIP